MHRARKLVAFPPTTRPCGISYATLAVGPHASYTCTGDSAMCWVVLQATLEQSLVGYQGMVGLSLQNPLAWLRRTALYCIFRGGRWIGPRMLSAISD